MFANPSSFEMAAKLLNVFLIYFQIKSFQQKIIDQFHLVIGSLFYSLVSQPPKQKIRSTWGYQVSH